MHDDLRNHAQQKVLDQADGEAEAGPVVAVLEDLEAVALEFDVTVKVHLVEGLHGDLVGAMVLGTVGLLLEFEVVLDRTAGVLGLGVLAGRDGGDNKPPADQDGQIKENGEEDEGLEATANLPLQPEGNAKQDGEHDLVVEGVGAWSISWEGSILDGGVLDGGTSNQLTGSWSLRGQLERLWKNVCRVKSKECSSSKQFLSLPLSSHTYILEELRQEHVMQPNQIIIPWWCGHRSPHPSQK